METKPRFALACLPHLKSHLQMEIDLWLERWSGQDLVIFIDLWIKNTEIFKFYKVRFDFDSVYKSSLRNCNTDIKIGIGVPIIWFQICLSSAIEIRFVKNAIIFKKEMKITKLKQWSFKAPLHKKVRESKMSNQCNHRRSTIRKKNAWNWLCHRCWAGCYGCLAFALECL